MNASGTTTHAARHTVRLPLPRHGAYAFFNERLVPSTMECVAATVVAFLQVGGRVQTLNNISVMQYLRLLQAANSLEMHASAELRPSQQRAYHQSRFRVSVLQLQPVLLLVRRQRLFPPTLVEGRSSVKLSRFHNQTLLSCEPIGPTNSVVASVVAIEELRRFGNSTSQATEPPSALRSLTCSSSSKQAASSRMLRLPDSRAAGVNWQALSCMALPKPGHDIKEKVPVVTSPQDGRE